MKTPLLAMIALPMSLLFSGCYVETIDDSHQHYPDTNDDSYNSWQQSSYSVTSSQFKMCQEYQENSLKVTNRDGRTHEYTQLECYQDLENQRTQNCEDDSCNHVPVYTHYILSKEFEGPMVAYIEAFDNPRFQGQPKASVRVEEFKAQRGHWQLNNLILAPGEYYLRSYLTNNEESTQPYQFGNLSMVANEPVGHFGALGTASMIRVPKYPQSYNGDPVNIYLDQLFESKSDKINTNAFLRINLKIEDVTKIPDNRNIVIQLRTEESLDVNPTYEFKKPTESLLISGREGSTDFVSPELEKGEYFLFTFIDSNENGYYDVGEQAAANRKYSAISPVNIKKNQTVAKSLVLKEVWQDDDN